MSKTPQVITIGIDKVIEKDLGKHKELLEQSKQRLLTYREAQAHQVQKKRHYASLIGGERYDDDALKASVTMINTDVRAMEDKVKLSKEEVAHHTLIVDTLTEQLVNYHEMIEANRDAIPARLLQ
jgi:hypothetical protein